GFVVGGGGGAGLLGAGLAGGATKDLAAGRSIAAARDPAAPAVWDEAAGNIAFVWRRGDASAGIERASHVVRLASQVSRVAALPLEPRGALGRVDETGRLVLHASNQSPHILKMALANLLQVPADPIRVVPH